MEHSEPKQKLFYGRSFKMLRYIVVFIIVTLISFSVYMAQYLGAFKSVEIRNEEFGPYLMVYLDHMGPYHKIVSKIEEVEKWASENQFDCRLSFGEYFDDPELVEEARLKSIGGCLIDASKTENTQQLLQQWTDKIQTPLKIKLLAKQEYIAADFSGSPGIGPIKVYPKIETFIQERKLKRHPSIIEIYEILDRQAKNQMQTRYLF